MKISGFFSPPAAKKERSPDSGFNSRSDTPAVQPENEEKEEEKEEGNETEEEVLDDTATEEELNDEKKKFLEDLEESDVEKEESEKEESEQEFDPNDSDDDVKKKGFMAKKAPPKRKAPA